MVGTACIHDGAYAYIERDARGQPLELLPLLPGSVTVQQNEYWELTYTISSGNRMLHQSNGADLLKLHGPMHTPVNSFAVSRIARDAVGLAAAVEGAVSRFHKNDLRPSGILTMDGKLSKEARQMVREEWTARYGPGGTGGIAVLDATFDFKAIATSGADSQTIEQRKFQIECSRPS